MPVQLCEREGRGGSGEKSETREDPRRKSSDEDGREERGSVATLEPEAHGCICPIVFAGFGGPRKCLSSPLRGERGAKVLNEALVKRVIPYSIVQM